MEDHGETHRKLLSFLMGEWARKDNRQLTEVELMYAPGNGFRDEAIQKWVRTDEPEFFAEYANVEKLTTTIIEIAENEAETKQRGKHRFVVRTKQMLGGQARHAMMFQPRYNGDGDETAAIVPNGAARGGGGNDIAAAQILASNNVQLMSTNRQMFDGTIRVLGQQNLNLHEQVMALTSENAVLRKELEEARSNKMDREFQMAMAAEKNQRTNLVFQKAMQLGTVAITKFAQGAQGQLPEGAGGPSPLSMLINEFQSSLKPEQMNVLMQTLDMAQKILFMEIVNLVRSQSEAAGPPQGGPGGPPPSSGNKPS